MSNRHSSYLWHSWIPPLPLPAWLQTRWTLTILFTGKSTLKVTFFTMLHIKHSKWQCCAVHYSQCSCCSWCFSLSSSYWSLQHIFSHFLFLTPFLCSRQRYVLGDSAMHQMAQSSVFLSGMGGLGIEIGNLKTIVLHHSFVRYSMPKNSYDWLCQLWFDSKNFDIFVTAKNIVLAGVKVSALTKYYDCSTP